MAKTPQKVDLDFQDGKDHSALMDMAFNDANTGRFMRLSVCISLYLVLAIIWMPGFSFNASIPHVNQEEVKPQKRKVLKPPPEKPLERVQTKEKKAKKMPMPDMTPDEPEPIVEPDPPPEPEVLPTDDWEIGIPDGPPEPQGDTIARVGETGVEPPVFTRKVPPKYPERAVKIKLQGYVILEAILRRDGTVDDIKVLRGLGKGKFGFEEEAKKALNRWEFLPGKVNGRPADVRMTLKIDFVLQ
ncbi:energy transducer TonB [Acanthopleuribacter pedis]|uniref:TonB family protein n=1 Tax=Acanthopleuribacter pedis TaxID=442870 RepID=A0A8J7U3T7_9BACT|nr:energy transducer TonB [Acanthopleuribacter pedis]MBO1319109.1 TonB family protein [Acanthopleuribacter pedis]